MRGWSHTPEARARMGAISAARQASPEWRAKMSEALILRPPPEDVEAMIKLYARMGTRAVAERSGYSREVVRRALREAGVALHAPGRNLRGLRADG